MLNFVFVLSAYQAKPKMKDYIEDKELRARYHKQVAEMLLKARSYFRNKGIKLSKDQEKNIALWESIVACGRLWHDHARALFIVKEKEPLRALKEFLNTEPIKTKLPLPGNFDGISLFEKMALAKEAFIAEYGLELYNKERLKVFKGALKKSGKQFKNREQRNKVLKSVEETITVEELESFYI